MNRGLNKVLLIGNLGQDPEIRSTSSGHSVTSFSVATNRIWKTKDGEYRNEADWFNIVAWDTLAERCKKQLVKGQQVYIEGRLKIRQWEDKQGNVQKTTEVIASDMLLIGDRLLKNSDPEVEQVEVDNFSETNDEEDFPF